LAVPFLDLRWRRKWEKKTEMTVGVLGLRQRPAGSTRRHTSLPPRRPSHSPFRSQQTFEGAPAAAVKQDPIRSGQRRIGTVYPRSKERARQWWNAERRDEFPWARYRSCQRASRCSVRVCSPALQPSSSLWEDWENLNCWQTSEKAPVPRGRPILDPTREYSQLKPGPVACCRFGGSDHLRDRLLARDPLLASNREPMDRPTTAGGPAIRTHTADGAAMEEEDDDVSWLRTAP
jgi:hypothetical protein